MADFIAADAAESAGAAHAHNGASATAPASSSTSASRHASPDFSTALSVWRNVSLPSLLSTIGSQAPALAEAQAAALVSRKKLAEQTREFKKLPSDDAKLEAIRSLLKAYQAEIDSLTKRAKGSENAFLAVWDRLKDAPDPYPLLELVLEQTVALADLEPLKAEVGKLQTDNAALRSQVASLPTLEAEKEQLSQKLASVESSSSAKTAQKAAALEAELSAKWDERIRNHVAREEDLSRSLSLAQSHLKELRAAHAKATEKLLQRGEEVDFAETSGRFEELDVAAEDLRRANERLGAVERRNEQLRAELEALKNGEAGSAHQQELDEVKSRLHEAEEQERRLTSQLREIDAKVKSKEDETKRKLDEAGRQVANVEKQAEALRAKLAKMGDYDELKRELAVIKYVDFAVEDDEEGEGAAPYEVDAEGGGEGGKKGASSAKPLEALLIEKNRKLQDEVTTMRVSATELQSQHAARERELKKLRDDVARLKSLNQRLEDDLLNVDPAEASRKRAKAREAAGAAGGGAAALKEAETSTAGGDAIDTPKEVNGRTSPIPFTKVQQQGASGSGSATPSGGGGESSILPIITSQRDRFRARNAELEEELRKQFETITELRNEVKTLQADNLSLYEKVRYLQAYGATSGASTTSGVAAAARGTGPRLVSTAARVDMGGAYPPAARGVSSRSEDKYRDRYEASVNPFEAFRGQEQSRALASLNPLERMLHMLTRLVLGHRRMRVLFMVYALALHLLIFAMLFELGHSSSGGDTSYQPVPIEPLPPM